MKSIQTIISTIMLLIVTIVDAQSPILPITTEPSDIPDDSYIKDMDNELDKFAGTWQYVNGDDILTISLQKDIQHFNGDYFEDELVGNYKYVVDGNIVMDYLDSPEEKLFSNRILSYPNEIRFIIIDQERKRLSYHLKLTYGTIRDINTGLPVEQLEWNLKITQVGYCGPYPNQPTPSPQDCLTDNRLPMNITLTKID